jgi:hypothetical protein
MSHLTLLHRLVKGHIDFVIVGGYAAIVHGCNYVTQDIDICCVFAPANMLSLQAALADLHPVHRMTPGRLPLKLTAENAGHIKNLYLDTDLGRLDCLSEIDGLGNFEEVKQASGLIETENMQLNVLTIDALIKAKKAMNRPRDQETIRQLQAIKALREGLDD